MDTLIKHSLGQIQEILYTSVKFGRFGLSCSLVLCNEISDFHHSRKILNS